VWRVTGLTRQTGVSSQTSPKVFHNSEWRKHLVSVQGENAVTAKFQFLHFKRVTVHTAVNMHVNAHGVTKNKAREISALKVDSVRNLPHQRVEPGLAACWT